MCTHDCDQGRRCTCYMSSAQAAWGARPLAFIAPNGSLRANRKPQTASELGATFAPITPDDVCNLLDFVQNVLIDHPDLGMDGFDIHDLAVKTGMLMPHKVTKACCEECNCLEYADLDANGNFATEMICYRKAEFLAGTTK